MPNMQLVEKYHEGLGEFSSQTRFEVGNGSKIRLWHDKWCGVQVLKEFFFPYLHSISFIKDAFVAYYLELSSDSHKQNVSFIKAAQDWEVNVFASFF